MGDWNVTRHRVIYGDTDAMGIVYYGNYMRFFEIGRNELFRARGGTYRAVEERGFMLPVVDVQIPYKAPAHYDDELDIAAHLAEATQASMTFGYVIRRGDVVICEGTSRHAFVDAQTRRPVRIPQDVIETFGG